MAVGLSACSVSEGPRETAGTRVDLAPVAVPLVPADRLRFVDIAPAALGDRPEAGPAETERPVLPGDILHLRIAGEPGVRATTLVMPDGMLYPHGLPGIAAAGLSVAEIGEEVARQVRERGLDAGAAAPVQVQVSFQYGARREIAILGQVSRPGIQSMEKPLLLSEALAAAGGVPFLRTQEESRFQADLRRAVLIREGGLVPVDFVRLVAEGDPGADVALRGDDILILPERRGDMVHVLGEVRRPGAIPFREDVPWEEISGLIEEIAVADDPGGFLLLRNPWGERPQVARVEERERWPPGGGGFRLQRDDIIWIPGTDPGGGDLAREGRRALDSARISVAILRAEGTADLDPWAFRDSGAAKVSEDP